jgi:hypothetical protein
MNAYQERVLAVARRIGELEAELARAKAEFASLVPEAPPSAAVSTRHHQAVEARERDRLLLELRERELRERDRIRQLAEGEGSNSAEASLVAMILGLFDGIPPTLAVTADDVCRNLPNAKIESVRTTLARLADQGRIEKVGRGEYRARPKSAAAAAPKEGG